MERLDEAEFLKVAGKEFAAKYRKLVRELRRDFPNVKVPEPAVSRLPKYDGNATMLQDYMVVGGTLIDRLSADELLAVVAHEFGHYYGRHFRDPMVGWDFNVMMNLSQAMECHADHFSARYVNPEHMKSALYKIAGGKWESASQDVQGWALEWIGYRQTHPRNWNRVALLENEELLKLKPSDVRYGRECEVLEIRVPQVPNTKQGRAAEDKRQGTRE